MGIDHRSPHVAVAQKRLDRADVVVGLKKMRCEGVAEGVGGDAFGQPGPADGLVKSLLKMAFMEMIASDLLFAGNLRKVSLREEPLPDELFCGFGIFLFKLIVKKDSGVTGLEVVVMQLLDNLLRPIFMISGNIKSMTCGTQY
jgi:hypothetical protein